MDTHESNQAVFQLAVLLLYFARICLELKPGLRLHTSSYKQSIQTSIKPPLSNPEKFSNPSSRKFQIQRTNHLFPLDATYTYKYNLLLFRFLFYIIMR